MKLQSFLIAASMFAATAVPALATTNWFFPAPSGVKLNNVATINSSASAMSGTGLNTINSCNTCGTQTFSFFQHQAPAPTTNTIISGVASSDSSSQVGFVNATNGVANLDTVNNFAVISSKSKAKSLTGMNMINGGGTNLIMSGNAGSLSSSLVTNINTTGFGLN